MKMYFFEEEGWYFWFVVVQYEVVLKGEDKIWVLDDV